MGFFDRVRLSPCDGPTNGRLSTTPLSGDRAKQIAGAPLDDFDAADFAGEFQRRLRCWEYPYAICSGIR